MRTYTGCHRRQAAFAYAENMSNGAQNEKHHLMWILTVMIFVRYLSEIRYFESRKPIIPTGFRYCVKLHFRQFRFRFLSGWNCFNGFVRNLNLECAWRQSYHSIKRIINPAFLSQRDADMARRWSARKRNQRTRHVDSSTIQYSHTWTLQLFVYLRDWNWNHVICQGRQLLLRVVTHYLKFCRVFSTVSLVF